LTRIDFYRYAEDKLRFACRLATIAFERSSKLVVYSSDAKVLENFDRTLWTLQATKFVPHCFAGAAVAAETPIVLSSSGDSLPHHEVLLNLDDEWPPFFSSFERVLEIVAADEDDKEKARARYVFYSKRGYDIKVTAIESQRGKGE
jgi:DNA polymerase-3 subunit chi